MANTKKILATVLKDMLHTKPLDKITVRQLVEACAINRQTFYYHFHDIYELLEYMFLVELEKMFRHITEVEKMTEKHLWERTYYIILYFLSQNKTMTMNAFHSIGKQKLEDVLYEVSYNIIMLFIEDELKGVPISQDEKIFIANFYKYAFVGITLDWMKNFMHVNPEEVVRRASYLVAGNIKRDLCNSCVNIEK